MTREDAIKNITTYLYAEFENIPKQVIEAMQIAVKSLGNDINVGGKLEKTEKYNRMIEAFECDFSLIEQGEKSFTELDKLMKDNRYSLAEDMDLMQELSYLLRHGKAEIWLKEGE